MRATFNNINANTRVFEGSTSGIFNVFGFSNAWFTSNRSLDRLSGGGIGFDAELPNNWFLNGNLASRFSFVPTYSSIDFRGPLNNDADHTIQINNIIGSNFQVLAAQQNLTPFQAIYGNFGINTQHSSSVNLRQAWNDLALQEFGLNENTFLSTCTIPVPPIVQQRVMVNQGRGRSFAYVNLPSTINFKPKYRALPDPNTITLAIPGDGSVKNYNQFIRITGPGLFYTSDALPRSGLLDFNYKDLSAGVYTVTSIRQYTGIGSSEMTNSTTFTLVDNGGARTIVSSDCPGLEKDGEILGVLSSTNETVYAIRYNNQWLAILEDGTFVSRSELIANGINSYGADCFVQVDPASPTPSSTCWGLGSITYERWENIGGGNTISNLLTNTNYFQNNTSLTQNISSFSAPSWVADNYGARIRGYVCPPITGNYRFWVSGDDHVELWLSTSEDPNNSVRIAYHNAWTPANEWSWYDTQKSAEIQLQAGNRYYIEARMKEGYGGDNLDVGWQLPNGALERPIQGSRLSPFSGTTNSCDFNIFASNSNSNPSPGQGITLTYSCSGPDCSGVSYAWSGHGISGNQSPKSINAPSNSGSYTYTISGSKNGCTKVANTFITVGSTTCQISDGQSLGFWQPSAGMVLPLKARLLNNQLWVTQVLDVNDPTLPYFNYQEAFAMRGRNILTRSDVTTSYASSYTCFSGGDTGIGGLIPPPAADPFNPSLTNYTYKLENDGFRYYHTPVGGGSSISVTNVDIPINCTQGNGTKKVISYSVSGGSGQYEHEFAFDGTWWNGNVLWWDPLWSTTYNLRIRDKNNTSQFVDISMNTGYCGQSGSWSVNSNGSRLGLVARNEEFFDEQFDQFVLFPNPVEDELSIKVNDGEEINKLVVYTLDGEIVQEAFKPRFTNLSVSHLSGGTYVLRLFTTNGIRNAKFIKL